MDALMDVAKHTGTKASDWEHVSGMETGVGVEFFVGEKKGRRLFYVCYDQGELISISEG